MDKLIPHIENCLSDHKNQSLKLDALLLLKSMLENHSAQVMRPYVSRFTDRVVQLVCEDWYKVIGEALRVLSTLIPLLRATDTNNSHCGTPIDASSAKKIFVAVYSR